MKIIYTPQYALSDYASDSASAPGRMEAIMKELENHYEILLPHPAELEDIKRAHGNRYIETIKSNKILYDMALLSAGGAIASSEIALKGEASFGCIRPPGHHASKNSSWGFCTFCNMAIALLRLKTQGRINSAFILDFDAHTGDGTIDILSQDKDIKILNPMAEDNRSYIKAIETYISKLPQVDIIAICAGFDTYMKDLGKKLLTFDFYVIGRLMKLLAKRMGHNRRFAILEGGYYQPDLGKNVLAFCQGLE